MEKEKKIAAAGKEDSINEKQQYHSSKIKTCATVHCKI